MKANLITPTPYPGKYHAPHLDAADENITSAIYYVDDAQKQVAIDTIADVEASGLWPGKVVTEVEPVGDFWDAEPEHQDYLERIPNGYTCHFVRPNWVLPKRSATAAE